MTAMRAAVQIVWRALEEIFDESAYRRFLERTGKVSSPEAYWEFLRESEYARVRRSRCC
jgi:hypothetical protein